MYVVSYDITSDRRRNKIAKALEGYGTRIQYSVFECRLTEKKYKEMYRKLMQLMTDEEDGSIRIYSICGNCEGKIRTIGEIPSQPERSAEHVIVI